MLVFLIQITKHYFPRVNISLGILNELDLAGVKYDPDTLKIGQRQTSPKDPISEIFDAGISIRKSQIRDNVQLGDFEEDDDSGVFIDGGLLPEFFCREQIISVEEIGRSDKEGHHKRVLILKTEFKYPYIRVEESFIKGADNQEDIILMRKAMVADHIIVKIKDEYGLEQLEQLNQKYQAETVKRLDSSQIYIVKLGDHTIDTVSNAIENYGLEQSLVAYVEPDYIVQILDLPDDPKFHNQWNLALDESLGENEVSHIGATKSWGIETGSADVIVAIVDTGIDYYHQDLRENIWENPGETGLDLVGNDKATNGIDDDRNGYIDDNHGWNFYYNNNDPLDDNRHGTHVAGIIGAAGNNGTGISGVCWKTSLLPIKFLSPAGIGVTSDAVASINYCTQLGVDVSNNSWGGGEYSRALKDAIYNAGQANCIVVTAAGNEGKNISKSPVYPAAYDLSNVLSVTASSQDGGLPLFANYGESNVDLAAPGVRILSTFPNDKYGYLDGTSMAAPHVAGALAMLKSRYPNLSAGKLKNRLLAATDADPILEAKCQTGGRLNLYKALNDELMADFEFDFDYGKAHAVIKFTNTSFGSTRNLRWDFGDGTPTTTDMNPTHIFEMEGIYHVTLTIEGSDGTSSKTRALSVMGNYTVGKIPFSWTDPTNMAILAELENDGVSTVQEMPFEFKFYGNTYNRLYIGSNGLMGFAPNGLERSSNRNLPQASLSTPALFPYWDDFNPKDGGTIRIGVVGDAPSRQVIVTWQDIPYFYKPSPPFSFQVVLNETSHEIEFHYRDVHPENLTIGGGRSATIGIQSANAVLATSYSYNGSSNLTNNQALLFSPENTSAIIPESPSHTEIYDLNIQTKWNLVSVPVVPLTSEISELFRGVSVSDITYWDNKERAYANATHVKPNFGYWIYSYQRLDVTIVGKRLPEIEIVLGMGWNLIGVTDVIRPDDYNIPIDTIWGWDPENQSYISISTEDFLVPGQGYWIYCNQEFNLKINR